MAPPPAHILRSIDARRETEGGPGEDEGGPGEDPLALDGESIPWEVPSTPPTLLFALGDELEYEDAFTFPKAQHGMPSPSSVMHGVASHRDAPPPKPLDLGVVRRVPEPQEPRRALPRRHSLG